MLKLLFLLTVVMLSGCIKGGGGCGGPGDYMIFIHYVDLSGKGLYPLSDTSEQNGWCYDSARLYSFSNGIITPSDTSDAHKYIGGVFLRYGPSGAGDSAFMLVQTNGAAIVNDSATYLIYLRHGYPVDTISCRFNNMGVIAVWYNGIQVLTEEYIRKDGTFFTIVK